MGGGEGILLAEILRQCKDSKGIVFDLPGSAATCAHIFTESGVSERAQFIEGSFFEEIPKNGDLYLLKNILHNWDDESCIKILKNIRNTLQPHARVLTIEAFIEPVNKPSFGKMSDVLMMVALGGKERTMEEFSAMFKAAGLRIKKIHKTISPFRIIEAVAG